jgi:5-formyltetrahydrofolate cyclo-ligase
LAATATIDALRAAKAALRKEMMAIRRTAHRAAGAAASETVCARFVATFAEALARRPVVSAYWPMGDELDVRPLLHGLHALGCRIGLPIVTPRGTPLIFRAWTPETPMEAGVFGTSHPVPDMRVTPELVIAAFLAFDRRGWRLGYGGGYYDRTLAKLRGEGPVLAVGVGYDAQEVAEVPITPSDERLDWVVTETRAIRAAP